MIEDGGFATYIPMSVAESEPLSMRERCIQMAFRLVPGINRSQLFKVNGQLFPRLPDNAIDAFAIYRDVRLMRTTPTHRILKPKRKHCEVHQGSVRTGYQSNISDDDQETCIELQELLHPAMEHKNKYNIWLQILQGL